VNAERFIAHRSSFIAQFNGVTKIHTAGRGEPL
jgi:hypothetical protein